MTESVARVDVAKNRIYITFRGFLNLDDAIRLKEDFRKALTQVTEGFTVLTDAQDYKPGSQEVQDVIASMAKMDAAAGVKKVARVVGSRPLGGMQIDRVAKDATEADYPSRHFETLEDAEAYLDSDTNDD